ncbi:P-loop containing nucleoside triphosphate hydrolase protein [Diplocarpon rosae]|nr:P-loop containing nucleoside triphosphate hydrolase protein [Diplocarpon rosae]
MADMETPEVSILLLGDPECGKSTFLSRIGKGSACHDSTGPIPLLCDGDQPFVFDVTLFNRPYRFEFRDTASPESGTLVQPDVIVLCYDISSRLSLVHAQRVWGNEIQRIFLRKKEVPVLCLGLKRDLRRATDEKGIIYPQEAYRIAQEMRCDRYMECSARTGELVHEVFEDICRTAAMSGKEEGTGGLSEGGCDIM